MGGGQEQLQGLHGRRRGGGGRWGGGRGGEKWSGPPAPSLPSDPAAVPPESPKWPGNSAEGRALSAAKAKGMSTG